MLIQKIFIPGLFNKAMAANPISVTCHLNCINVASLDVAINALSTDRDQSCGGWNF